MPVKMIGSVHTVPFLNWYTNFMTLSELQPVKYKALITFFLCCKCSKVGSTHIRDSFDVSVNLEWQIEFDDGSAPACNASLHSLNELQLSLTTSPEHQTTTLR